MRVAEFIAGARALTAGGGDEAAADRLRKAVEEEMPVRYAMPFPADIRTTFHRRGQPTRTRRGQWHELVQHLTDLAYLRVADFTAWHARRAAGELPDPALLAAVLGGVDQFLSEDDYRGFALLPDPTGTDVASRVDWLERYLSTIVFRLTQLTSFDGELPVKPDYRVGERSVYGRSLAFRMRVYFFNYQAARRTGRRKIYFDRSLLPQLVTLTSFLGPEYHGLAPKATDRMLSGELQTLLLNWDRLFDAYRRHPHRLTTAGRFYLQYRLPDGYPTTKTDNQRRAERLSRRAARWVRRNDDHVDTGVNHFGVRLAQLGLWRAGFYTGQLDGDIGPLSHRALLLLVKQEQAYGDMSDRRLLRVLVPVGDSALDWLVDFKLLARLLERYVPAGAEEMRAEEDAIWTRIQEAGQEGTVDEAFASRQREARTYYGDLARHPGRRVYYGLRGLIRGAFRAIGRIIKWIAGAVEEILGAVFDFVKAVAKRVQEGIGTFFAGFLFFAHYLLGRPFITLGTSTEEGHRPVLFTRFRIDFDVVSLVGRGADRVDVARHQQYLQESGRGAAYFMDVIVTCIRAVALLQPPIGWLRLAVLVARLIHDFLRTAGQPNRAVA